MLQTGIQLQDNFTGVLYDVMGAVSLAISSMYDMQQALSMDIDMSSMEGARDAINQATMALDGLNGAMGQTPAPAVPDAPAQAQWQPSMERVFTGTGADRFQQEIASANRMMEQLSRTQDAIARQAYSTELFPQEAFRDLNSMAVRIDAIRDHIQQIGDNPMNMGTDAANAGLEQTRGHLAQITQQQEDLRRAMENMDVSAANEAYLRLSRTVGDTERYIRDNVDEQGRFNQQIRDGASHANGLVHAIGGAIAAYATMHTLSAAINLSDQLTSTTARLDMMNDGLQATEGLQEMIFLSAERARGSYQATADAVAKLGLMAGDAFSSNAEIIGFMEQVNKQFTIAGTEASGIEAAMLQLTQAMGSGVLRGEEFNSILEQAPNIIQSIADYMGVPKGQLKDMAAEGQITAEVVKAAMFDAADETNAKFESMPMTFEQVGTSLQNTAMVALQPLLENLNSIANSPAFQEVVSNAAGALSMLVGIADPILAQLANSPALWDFANGMVQAFSLVASIALQAVGLLVDGANMIAENWSWISPIVYRVAAALALYVAYLAIVKVAELVSTASKIAMCVASYAHAAATGAEASATAAATAAQYGLNTALLSCPLTWVILLIIALVAVIFAVCNAIAKMTGIANTGFGVITGGINVVIAFFRNLGLGVANIALGIGNAIAALASNMMTAFHNAICSIQSWFYSLLSTALSVIGGICEKLNKLPFVEFDYSGITSAANDYAAKAAEAAGEKGDYESIGDAFEKGMSTYEAFKEGWAADAFDEGASWGDGVAEKVSGMLDGLTGAFGETANPGGFGGGIGDSVAAGVDGSGAAGDIGDIAGNTGAIKDAMDITQEDLKYLRDIAEQETVNRFTLAEVHIEQNINNNVSSSMDLDGIVDSLASAMDEAVGAMAEGVHA